MKVFIIDDDKISIYLTRHILKTAGFSGTIVTFLCAEEALAVLKTGNQADIPQIILLDINMPGMDGWGFLNALEPYKSTLIEKCAIYILTSSLELSDSNKAKEYEIVRGYIHKPIKEADVPVILAQLKTEDKPLGLI